MAHTPRNQREQRIADLFTTELRSIVQATAGPKLVRLLTSNTGQHLRSEDVELMIIGLALRMQHRDILTMVNDARAKDGLSPATATNLTYYQRKYVEVIDEVYANVAYRIGEVYALADKIVRIARLNELGELFYDSVKNDFRVTGGEIEEITIKKANVFVRVMDRLNVEMGNKGLTGANLPPRDPEKDEPDQIPMSAETVGKLIDQKYGAQLPASVTEKIDFSDYTNCANGEKMGESDYVCWNDKMTDGNPGGRCAVQLGRVRTCPKFLNKGLLEDGAWFLRQRENGISLKKMASIVGCVEYDQDVKDRIFFYARKHNAVKISNVDEDEPVDQDTNAESEGTETPTEGTEVS